MNGYNFSDRVRRVLQMAREEATRLHHAYVGTEHILLGLIREGGGVAAAVLTNLNVDLGETRRQIEETVTQGKAEEPAGPDLPYTSRAKRVLELAMTEARELSHSYVGTEHLLLGLLREEKGVAARVLKDAGLSLAAARAETVRLVGAGQSDEAGARVWPKPAGPAPMQPAGAGAAAWRRGRGPWSAFPLSLPVFFVRVGGGLWFLVSGIKEAAVGSSGAATAGAVVGVVCGALLVAGWRRRDASVVMGFLLLVVSLTRLVREPGFNVAAFLLPRLALLLPGLTLSPDYDRWSVDRVLLRR